MSENVTIIFYPYIYNNKIDFAGKETYTKGKNAVDVLSKLVVTMVTKWPKWGKIPKKKGFGVLPTYKLQIIRNFTIFANRSQFWR
jgi:hypothetical protein